MLGNSAFVLKGKEAWTATTQKNADVLRPDIMLDRVINVKINYVRYNVLEDGEKQQYASSYIIIRSDYEPVASTKSLGSAISPQLKAVNGVTNGRFDGTAATHYEKVRIKPDIRLTYRGHGSAGIKFEVTIGNFFTLLDDGDIAAELNSASSGIEIKSIEVLFGYLSQFPNLAAMPDMYNVMTYNNFADRRYSNASYIHGSVLYWYRSAAPPDGAYTFYCSVVDVDANTLSQIARVNNSAITAYQFSQQLIGDYKRYITPKKYSLESVLEWYITKHYIRPNTNYIAANTEMNDTKNHCLTEKGSALFGVQVFVMSYNISVTASEKYLDAFISLKSNVVSMLNAIKNAYYPKLEFKFDVDGNVYIYDADEKFNSPKVRRKLAEVEVKTAAKIEAFNKNITDSGLSMRTARPQGASAWYVTIPAVYALQYGPITNISCPYFSVLFPGQKVLFNASYSVAKNQGASISTQIEKISQQIREVPEYNSYTVLYYDVDFSTISEYNNMNLYCVR